ncbi:hypothetical protein FA15DRAFT_668571 [Coprinopsis marcescibilis]|uniref:Uncharacterized protein n=1 Tax=Coprinopsis marcescibilis TaxID=230819 RepID=A0A5C3KXH2_COPMA|nr:hypothetical protein FA15DRAFT_668571 [Coprinopsis marcescibilis]
MLFKSTTLVATLLAAASVTSAQLRVVRPSRDIWWVAESTNVMEWSCRESQQEQFTILIGKEGDVIPPLPIFAIQNNFQCSIEVTQDKANQVPGDNYLIYFANIINNTDVYAISEPFEIRPLGSAYPAETTRGASPSASGGANAPGASDGATGNKNAALSLSGSSMGLATGLIGLVSAAAAAML